LGPEKAAASVPFGSDIRILLLRGAFTNVRTSETLVKLIDLVCFGSEVRMPNSRQ
jgi:hypothetical protein